MPGPGFGMRSPANSSSKFFDSPCRKRRMEGETHRRTNPCQSIPNACRQCFWRPPKKKTSRRERLSSTANARPMPRCDSASRRCCGHTTSPTSHLDDLVESSSPSGADDCTEPDDVRPPAYVGDATLDQIPSPEATEPPALRPISEGPGTRIGPYKLREKIGEGGMGVVYLAEQEKPVRRRVALKIIKPGMDTEQVVARFEAKCQALAIMDHPSIARVLDAGATETGRPYFVMELVKGVPITDYCDTVHLSPKERLELFVPVCQAIQHAHQKGIIHRDVKPSNVLVTMQDGKPVPKIIDFGIAKAIEQKLTERWISSATWRATRWRPAHRRRATGCGSTPASTARHS